MADDEEISGDSIEVTRGTTRMEDPVLMRPCDVARARSRRMRTSSKVI